MTAGVSWTLIRWSSTLPHMLGEACSFGPLWVDFRPKLKVGRDVRCAVRRAVQSQGNGAAERSTAGPVVDRWVDGECKSISCSPGMGNDKPDLPPLFIGSHHHSIPSQRKPPEVLAPLSPPDSQTAKDRLRHLHHQPGRTCALARVQLNNPEVF